MVRRQQSRPLRWRDRPASRPAAPLRGWAGIRHTDRQGGAGAV